MLEPSHIILFVAFFVVAQLIISVIGHLWRTRKDNRMRRRLRTRDESDKDKPPDQ